MRAAPFTVKVPLAYPVKVDGVECAQLVMRRPKGRDMKLARRASNGDDVEMDTILFANLCEVAPDVIDELDLADLKRLQTTFESFLSAPSPTAN